MVDILSKRAKRPGRLVVRRGPSTRLRQQSDRSARLVIVVRQRSDGSPRPVDKARDTIQSFADARRQGAGHNPIVRRRPSTSLGTQSNRSPRPVDKARGTIQSFVEARRQGSGNDPMARRGASTGLGRRPDRSSRPVDKARATTRWFLAARHHPAATIRWFGRAVDGPSGTIERLPRVTRSAVRSGSLGLHRRPSPPPRPSASFACGAQRSPATTGRPARGSDRPSSAG